MQRTTLLSELVEIDAKIIAATSLAAHTRSEKEFERRINGVRELRKKRAEIQAKLDKGREQTADS